MLPKLRPLPCAIDGGRPPLAVGCGMGEGEWSASITRLPSWAAGAAGAWACCGLFDCAPSGALMEPKLMGGLPVWLTGPPFCVYPLEPVALMTMEGFLPCSAEPLDTPLGAGWEPPCAAGPAPFTGDSDDFALLVEAPAAAGGVEDAVLVAALAYDRRGCAGTAPVCGVVEPEMVEAAEAGVWLAEGEAALVMGGMDGECGVCRTSV